jgi:uncharacterized membrane protein YhiD involved in acid resistance
MAAGAGAYLQAIVGTVLVLLTLTILGRFGDNMLPYHFQERVLRVTTLPDNELIDGVEKYLSDAGYAVRIQEIEHQEDRFVVSLSARGRRHEIEIAMRELIAREGIIKVVLGGR